MTEPSDPPRLSDAPGGLGDALRGAREDVGVPAQLTSLSARLGPLLGPPPAGPPGMPPTTGAGIGVAKLVVSGIALIVAGGAAWRAATYQPVSPPAPSPPRAQVAAPAAPPSPAAQTPLAAPAAPAEPTALPGDAAGAASAPVPSPAKPLHAAALSEADLLEQARLGMKSDPARALARANEHRQRFPGGALIQEREVIAIKALRALGRTSEADARAAAFAKAFPGSAFARKLKPSP